MPSAMVRNTLEDPSMVPRSQYPKHSVKQFPIICSDPPCLLGFISQIRADTPPLFVTYFKASDHKSHLYGPITPYSASLSLYPFGLPIFFGRKSIRSFTTLSLEIEPSFIILYATPYVNCFISIVFLWYKTTIQA